MSAERLEAHAAKADEILRTRAVKKWAPEPTDRWGTRRGVLGTACVHDDAIWIDSGDKEEKPDGLVSLIAAVSCVQMVAAL